MTEESPKIMILPFCTEEANFGNGSVPKILELVMKLSSRPCPCRGHQHDVCLCCCFISSLASPHAWLMAVDMDHNRRPTYCPKFMPQPSARRLSTYCTYTYYTLYNVCSVCKTKYLHCVNIEVIFWQHRIKYTIRWTINYMNLILKRKSGIEL